MGPKENWPTMSLMSRRLLKSSSSKSHKQNLGYLRLEREKEVDPWPSRF
jgi:hypothetical protein